jgi:RNA polymerase-binding transcription factor DksA
MAARDITRYEQRLLAERARILKAGPDDAADLAKVDSALRYLYTDPIRYGHCAACGVLIPWALLDRYPTSQVCEQHFEVETPI